jgi:hypothetical protein
MSIIDFGKSLITSGVEFFKDDPLGAVKSIGSAVKTVTGAMKTAMNFKDDPLVGIANPNTQIGGRVSTELRRSIAGKPGFSDIGEASFYKYAQLQNTVRYLYSQKSRYKSIAKDKA